MFDEPALCLTDQTLFLSSTINLPAQRFGNFRVTVQSRETLKPGPVFFKLFFLERGAFADWRNFKTRGEEKRDDQGNRRRIGGRKGRPPDYFLVCVFSTFHCCMNIEDREAKRWGDFVSDRKREEGESGRRKGVETKVMVF